MDSNLCDPLNKGREIFGRPFSKQSLIDYSGKGLPKLKSCFTERREARVEGHQLSKKITIGAARILSGETSAFLGKTRHEAWGGNSRISCSCFRVHLIEIRSPDRG